MKTVPLAEACQVITDGTHYTPSDTGTGIPFLTVKDVGPRGLDFNGCARISEADFAVADAGTSAPKRGDVLFSKDGTVGKVHVVETDERFAVLSSLAILRPAKSVDSRFLGHMLSTPDVLAQAVRRKSGSAIRRIILSDLKKVEIPLPPLSTQRRMAEILDRANLIRTQRQQVLTDLDGVVPALFNQLLPGVDGSSVPLSEVAEIWDCPHSTPKWTESGVVCLRTPNLTRGGWDWKDTRYVDAAQFAARSKGGGARPGDIILSREGTVGIAAIVEPGMQVCMGQRLVQVRPDPSALLPPWALEFLLTALHPDRISRLMVGSTAKHLNVKDLRALPIPLPSIRTQETFVRQARAVGAIRKRAKQTMVEDDALLASLQSRAVRGEL